MRTASEIKNISFKHAILAQLDVRNVTPQSAAVRIGIAPRTFYMRLSDPGSFRVSELRSLAASLNMAMDDLTRWI